MNEAYLVQACEILAKIKWELGHSKTVTYQTELELKSFLEDANLKVVIDGILNPHQPKEPAVAEEPAPGPVEIGAEGTAVPDAGAEGGDPPAPEVKSEQVDGSGKEEAV